MAVDLAKLVVSLEAQNGQILSKLEQTEKRLKSFEQRTNATVRKVSAAFKGLFGAAAIGAGIKAIVDATAESEKQIAQLEAALKSTGGTVGYTSKQIQDFAAQLQSKSTFDDEAIINLQTRLLAFGNVTGDVFKRATQATADLSARLGRDLASSALLVGKALNDPVKGLAGLARAGVQFDASQKAVIKALAETGHLAEAQGMILDELQKKFGGAAEAARNTMGGALEGLRNAFGNLLEAHGGVNDATAAVNEFTRTLESDAVKQAAESLASGVVSAFWLIVQAIAGAVNMARSFGETLAFLKSGPALDSLDSVNTRLAIVNERIADAQRVVSQGGLFAGFAKKDLDAFERERRELLSLKSLYEDLARTAASVPGSIGQRKSPAGAKALFESASREFDAARNRNSGSGTPGPRRQTTEYAHALMDEANLILEQEQENSRKSMELAKATNEYKLAQAHNYMVQAEGMLRTEGEKFDSMSEFAKEAARNMQDAFADFLFDPFRDGAQGMLRGFVDILRRMAAEAVASKIFDAIGAWGKKHSGGGGLLGALAGIAGSFGGAKDSGGSVGAGQFALVGERGPELVSGPASITSRADTSRMMGAMASSRTSRPRVKIVNALSPSELAAELMSTHAGEQAVLNIWGRNRRRLREA